MFKVVATMLVLFAVGCAAPARQLDYKVQIDPGMLPSHAEAVIAAVDAWRAAVPALHVDVSVAACTPGAVCVSETEAYASTSSEELDGLEDKGQIALYVNTIIAELNASGSTETSTHRIQCVATHELGHAWGLGHSGAGNVMSPLAGEMPADCQPTANDVAAFWGVK